MAQGAICLSVVSGVNDGCFQVFGIKKRITIGRTRANKFQLKSDTVSSKHGYIAYKDGRWFVTDSESSNGTAVNGVRVTAGVPLELKDGDILVIGVGSDNNVRVKIETPGKIDVYKDREMYVEDSAEEAKESDLRSLSVKQWIQQEIERLSADCDASVQAVLKEMTDYAEQMKKDIRSKGAAGV